MSCVLVAVLLMIFLLSCVRWRKRRTGRREQDRYAHGLCMHCGYDLRATVGICPECGADLFAQGMVYWRRDPKGAMKLPPRINPS